MTGRTGTIVLAAALVAAIGGAAWTAGTAAATPSQAGPPLRDVDGLPRPDLGVSHEYVIVPLPAHFIAAARGGRGLGAGGRGGGTRDRGPGGRGGNPAAADNTPAGNPITNAGATLGRVLFYDVRLSVNNTVACASCHQQAFNFSDPRRFSPGVSGGMTARHSMSLANARFYANGRFFWDERAPTLEAQVLMPIADPVEMGLSLAALEAKLAKTTFYPRLFEAAFGDATITRERVGLALAQFVRALVSADSKFDRALAAGPRAARGPRGAGVAPANGLTEDERLGQALFEGRRAASGSSLRCSQCHRTAAQITGAAGSGAGPGGSVMNTGLDRTVTDEGAGRGRFKAPSLRNIAASAPYMHDGRFRTLADVVEFYSTGVQDSLGLHPALRDRATGRPIRMNLTAAEKAALVAFLKTLTDEAFLTDPKFSDPFAAAHR